MRYSRRPTLKKSPARRKSRRLTKGALKEVSREKRSEAELQTQLQRIQALHEIETAVASSLDLRAIPEIAVEKIRLLLPYSNGFIRLLNGDTGLLAPVSWWNLEMDQWNKLPWIKSGTSTAYESGGPLIIRNVLKDPRAKHPDLAVKLGVISYLGIPLVAKGNKLGVISFNTKEEREFTS